MDTVLIQKRRDRDRHKGIAGHVSVRRNNTVEGPVGTTVRAKVALVCPARLQKHLRPAPLSPPHVSENPFTSGQTHSS